MAVGFHNKHHKLGGLNNGNLYLTVLEVGSPWSRCPKVWLLLRTLSLACSVCLLTVSSYDLLSVSGLLVYSFSYMDTCTIGLAPHTYDLIKGPVWTVTWGLGLQHGTFGGHDSVDNSPLIPEVRMLWVEAYHLTHLTLCHLGQSWYNSL